MLGEGVVERAVEGERVVVVRDDLDIDDLDIDDIVVAPGQFVVVAVRLPRSRW